MCPRVKPPQTGRRYPSLPHWLAQRRQRRELRGEELRLLYVAMTRARDTLILTGERHGEKMGRALDAAAAGDSRKKSPAQKVLPTGWRFGSRIKSKVQSRKVQSGTEGELPDLRWRIVDDAELAAEQAESGKRKAEMELPALDDEDDGGKAAGECWNGNIRIRRGDAAQGQVVGHGIAARGGGIGRRGGTGFQFSVFSKTAARMLAPRKSGKRKAESGN